MKIKKIISNMYDENPSRYKFIHSLADKMMIIIIISVLVTLLLHMFLSASNDKLHIPILSFLFSHIIGVVIFGKLLETCREVKHLKQKIRKDLQIRIDSIMDDVKEITRKYNEKINKTNRFEILDL